MARAQVSELDLERDDSYTLTSSGERRRRGVTLAHLRERTGSTGVIQDPETRADVHIDLAPWADRDPETTIIQLRWYWDDQEAFEEIIGTCERHYE